MFSFYRTKDSHCEDAVSPSCRSTCPGVFEGGLEDMINIVPVSFLGGSKCGSKWGRMQGCPNP